MTGSFNLMASSRAFPPGERFVAMKPPTTMITNAISAYHHLPMNAVVLKSIRVTNGNLACNDAKKTSKRGMTKTARTNTVTTDIAATTAG